MYALYLITLPLIIFFCGLSVDVGMLELKRAQMQSAADAAAFGAQLEAERGTGNWVAMAKADASVNGFTDGSNGVSISVAQQPTYGAYAGRYDALQVTISQTVRTYFMGAINGGNATINAYATALMTPCVYLTGTGTLQTYAFEGYSGALKGDSCPMYFTSVQTTDASLAPEAVNISGSASGSSISGYVWPTPNYNAPTLSDPLAYITEPSFSSCTHTSYSVTSGTVTLNPGTFCKGLNISNATVTLNPGLYIITGGANWTSATITGTGVTLFFTSGGGGSDSKFQISSSTVTLSAPNDTSSGGVPAIVVFTDRTWTKTSTQDVAVMNSTVTTDGIWYLPKTGLYVSNSGTVTGTHYFGLDADNLYLTGTTVTALNNYTSITSGNPFETQSSLVQ